MRENSKNIKRRITAFTVAVLLVFSLFAADLFRIQIVHAEDYTVKSVALSTSDTVIEAARGEILDTNGIPLVTNRQINSIVFNGSYFPSTKEQEQRNEIILSLINLLEKHGTAWNFDIPMYFDENGQIQFKPDSDKDIRALKSKSILYLNDYATAQNCFDELKEKFNLRNYSDSEALKIGSVCYSLKKEAFSTANPYTFADDVSVELASKVRENSSFYQGVEIKVVSERQYLDGTIAPHIIGVVGKLNAEEYNSKTEEFQEALKDETKTAEELERLKLRAYSMDDIIGKFGLEASMENYLRGTNGIESTVTDAQKNKTTQITVAPVQGCAVVTTINSELQKSVQQSLASFVESHRENRSIPAVGSAVVMEVNTGAVIACATYPGYNLATYYDDYQALSEDKASPLWNRALQSTYEPGSTFKLSVALAGLEEGVINENTKFHCNHIYDQFEDTTFKCLGTHGNIDVREAINQSCNIFFYETGRLLGIEKMNDYASRLGLGQKTGVEVSESTGVLAGIAYRESHGGIWYPGDTVQAAIGQSDNLYTPIQLCSYVATVANGGTRYKAHFVKSVKSADYSETYIENTPIVLNETGISQRSFDIVREGMVRLGQRTAAFADLPVTVAAKTGTAESKAKVAGKIESGLNGFMVSFAPAENPEIAVCVAIENLNSGAATATLAADIYRAYFGVKSEVDTSVGYNTVLN
ncbi:MAG: hypothetical protein E7514_01020 [Ruminococcaceae bacterium]|nr:hypothetical protein [Oscillospiraceae bacterium]